MKPRPTLYILDAYSLIYQVFHAIPLMTGPAGQPTQAVFGIFRDLVNLVRDRKPDYLAAAFDGAGRVFRSDQVVDLLALTGDTADNVPGVPGIGLKTGAKLLEEFGDLETLLANVDKVSGAKRKENLREFAETARRARSLIVLREDLQLE